MTDIKNTVLRKMDKHPIRASIIRFFENDYSEEDLLKFQQWLSREEDRAGKDEVLNELWEREEAEANEHTLKALEDMNRRIGKGILPAPLSFSHRLLRVASILLLPIIGGLLTYWFIHNNPDLLVSSLQAPAMVEHIVPDGEIKHVLLPDGSEVWLNAGSMLLYPDEFSGPSRRLFLDGEATFRVKKHPARPFIVKSQHIQVEALGTTFNVKSYDEIGITAVTLEEGSIRVDIMGKITISEIIQPDEQLVYDHRRGETTKLQVDAELVSRWKEGYLVFQDASFEEIIRTIERRFNATVYYDIRKYGGGQFSVKYSPYENVKQVLTILETLNPGLTWSIENDIIHIR